MLQMLLLRMSYNSEKRENKTIDYTAREFKKEVAFAILLLLVSDTLEHTSNTFLQRPLDVVLFILTEQKQSISSKHLLGSCLSITVCALFFTLSSKYEVPGSKLLNHSTTFNCS